uniref:Uncharacterized protein n=1 Tax=Anguilla anguilla TaxID=7936 RepID=A0A0E9TLY2_ANGAN
MCSPFGLLRTQYIATHRSLCCGMCVPKTGILFAFMTQLRGIYNPVNALVNSLM